MTNPDNRFQAAEDLRQKAEALARQRTARTPKDSAALSPEDIRKTLHELQVHQIELEMQNEELRTAQAEVEAGRARYFDLYDLAPVGYCTLSEQGLILEANLTAATLLGAARGELVKQPISRFILKENQDGYYLHRKRLFEKGKPQECELRLVKPDGALFWAHLTSTAAQAEDGSPVCRVVISDITERKQAEEHLEIFKQIVSSTSDGISLLDNDYRYVIVNEAYETFSGRRMEELIGVTVAEYLGESVFDEYIRPHFDRSLNGETVRFRDWFEYPTLGKRFVEVTYYPYMDAMGDISGVVANTRDITERERAEESLRESKELLSRTQRIAHTGSWKLDLTVNRLTWSDEVYRIFGCEPQEFAATYEAFLDAVHPDDRAAVDEGYSRSLREGSDGYEIEHRVVRRNSGEVRHVHERCVHERDAAGAIIQSTGMVQDITDRRGAAEALLKTNRQLEDATARSNEMAEQAGQASIAKSEFLANMSHEIRTPMTAILGFAGAALDGCPGQCNFGAGEHREHLRTIVRNGEYLLNLINGILDLSKVEAGKLEVERISCSPSLMVAEVESLVRVRGTAKGLELRTAFEGPIPEAIPSDPTRLRQILINMVGNAVKFTETGHVSLITRLGKLPDGESALEFDVVDTGLGMTDEQAARLFQPFSQADTSTTRKFGGTGLGLAVSKRLAEALGGDIRLVKTAPGMGSVFRLIIPAGLLDGVRMLDRTERTRQLGPEKQPATTRRTTLPDCRVLLAEDGVDNQRLIGHLLKKAGAQVTIFENGRLAAEAALAVRDAGNPFDAVLMDMQMPVMDGYEATALLRRQGYTGPIIALTAHAMGDDRQKCLDAGCDDYLSKPMTSEELFGIIARHVKTLRPAQTASEEQPVGHSPAPSPDEDA